MLNVFGTEVVKDFEDYTKFEEFRLPWGNCVGEKGEAYTTFQKKMMNDTNIIRNTSVQVTEELLKDLTPVFEEDYYYKFIKDKLIDCRFICLFNTENSYPGTVSKVIPDIDTDISMSYGLANVVFHFEYNSALRKFIPHFSSYALNISIDEQMKLRGHLNGICDDTDEEKDEQFLTLLHLGFFEKLEFIPIYISGDDGVKVSHRAYRKDGFLIEEVISPTLGDNILNNPEIMKGLEDWLSKGMKINKRNVYVILSDKNDRSKYYLKRYVR